MAGMWTLVEDLGEALWDWVRQHNRNLMGLFLAVSPLVALSVNLLSQDPAGILARHRRGVESVALQFTRTNLVSLPKWTMDRATQLCTQMKGTIELTKTDANQESGKEPADMDPCFEAIELVQRAAGVSGSLALAEKDLSGEAQRVCDQVGTAAAASGACEKLIDLARKTLGRNYVAVSLNGEHDLIVSIPREAFDAVPHPARVELLKQMGDAWCTQEGWLPYRWAERNLDATITLHDFSLGTGMARYECKTKSFSQ